MLKFWSCRPISTNRSKISGLLDFMDKRMTFNFACIFGHYSLPYKIVQIRQIRRNICIQAHFSCLSYEIFENCIPDKLLLFSISDVFYILDIIVARQCKLNCEFCPPVLNFDKYLIIFHSYTLSCLKLHNHTAALFFLSFSYLIGNALNSQRVL